MGIEVIPQSGSLVGGALLPSQIGSTLTKTPTSTFLLQTTRLLHRQHNIAAIASKMCVLCNRVLF